MFRNYLSAALNDLGRNWLYAGITILGLAASFAAAIVIGLYLRDEYNFERFLPGYERAYRVEADVTLPGQKPSPMIFTSGAVAGFLKLDFPEIQSVARLRTGRPFLKRGEAATAESAIWVDPDFFKVMPYPVLAGDPRAAAQAPDGLVLTRAVARKYFGVDAPIGRTLLVNPAEDATLGYTPDEQAAVTSFHSMRVMAVLKDIPSNTHLNVQIFMSGGAPFSPLAIDDLHPSPYNIADLTYLKLRPGVAPQSLTARMAAFSQRRYPGQHGGPPGFHFRLMPLAQIHFSDIGMGPDILRPSVDPKIDTGIAAVGVLIVVIAAINFVTLMTARASRRAVEVGVRKAVGARRGDLVIQFMGETLIYVLVSLVLAAALTELVLPYVDAFLQRTLTFDYLSDAGLAGALVGSALAIAVLAGLYPSVALSSFRPAAVLGGGGVRAPGSAAVRNALVVAQFAILIGLIVMTATIYRQTQFALNNALRLDTSQVASLAAPCRSAFAQQAAALPGVKAKSCASFGAMTFGENPTSVIMPDQSKRTVDEAVIDVGFFEMHGLKPLAGRFFSKDRGEDMALDRPDPGPDLQPSVVINESAARLLGYARSADAVGKTVAWIRNSAMSLKGPPAPRGSPIIGVVGDFTLGTIRRQITPQVFDVYPARSQFVLLKLDGRTMPETLRALQQLWSRNGHDRPADVLFESQYVQDLYKDVITQGVAIAVCSGLAILIACLGLFALAAFTTERRTKEIGVRKAMGAGRLDILRLLLWQFTKPVLWANLIAWPLAFWAMDHWLHGFAYRVSLPPWLFLAAAAAAVLIAWTTVAIHAWAASRAAPATALRYE